MKLFSRLMEKVLHWSEHPHATWYLGGLSFAESSFFPIPPDVMLIPMALRRPQCAWTFATITTVASVIGGIFGYFIGLFAFELVEPLIRQAGYGPKYQEVRAWFDTWGIWVVFLAGFSPIPYKLFTLTAGALAMSFLPFVLASLIGRGARFYLVAGLMRMGGARMEAVIHRYIDRLGWIVIAAAIVVFLVYGV
ncbi:MAG TPA: DedA family protein [Thiotrichales bacterium]|nr:DedA family protein [Thiotrichales bacterium]